MAPRWEFAYTPFRRYLIQHSCHQVSLSYLLLQYQTFLKVLPNFPGPLKTAKNSPIESPFHRHRRRHQTHIIRYSQNSKKPSPKHILRTSSQSANLISHRLRNPPLEGPRSLHLVGHEIRLIVDLPEIDSDGFLRVATKGEDYLEREQIWIELRVRQVMGGV
jgi:hypothetical protein